MTNEQRRERLLALGSRITDYILHRTSVVDVRRDSEEYQKLMRELANPVRGVRMLLPAADDPRLAKREAEVCSLAKSGFGNRGIAAKMGITVQTVKIHLSNARNKTLRQ